MPHLFYFPMFWILDTEHGNKKFYFTEQLLAMFEILYTEHGKNAQYIGTYKVLWATLMFE